MTTNSAPPAPPPPGLIKALNGVCALLMVLMVIGPSLRPLTADDDLWAHAATGRWILAHHRIPHDMLFLWSDHSFWLAHSWASQVMFGLMLRLGELVGARMAQVFTVVMALTAMGLLFGRWYQRAGATVFIPLFGSPLLWLASDRFHPRPEMVSMVSTALLLVWMEAWTREPAKPGAALRRCLQLGALFAVWANFHGLVFIGVALLFVGCFGESLERLLRRDAGRGSPFEPVAWAAAGVLGTFLNPYGPGLWRAIGYLRAPAGKHNVQIIEFLPPFATPGWGLFPQLIICILPPLAFLAWWLAPRRRLAPLMWWLLGTALVFMARRHCGTFASAMLITFAASEFSGARLTFLLKNAEAELAAVPALPVFTRAMALVLVVCGLSLTQPQNLWAGPLAPDLPRPMCNFLDANHPRGRMFNDYNISSYLTWREGETLPLGFHLLNVNPVLPELFNDALTSIIGGKQYLDRNGINLAVLMPFHDGDKPRHILSYFGSNPQAWALVYSAADGMVWVRCLPENAGLRARFHPAWPAGVAISMRGFPVGVSG